MRTVVDENLKKAQQAVESLKVPWGQYQNVLGEINTLSQDYDKACDQKHCEQKRHPKHESW